MVYWLHLNWHGSLGSTLSCVAIANLPGDLFHDQPSGREPVFRIDLNVWKKLPSAQ